MNLDQMDAQVEQIRNQAAGISAAYQNTVRGIRADSTLSEVGKAQQLEGLWETAAKEVADLQQQERDLVAQTKLALEQALFGTAGATGADIISFRDARDRASQITDPAEAARALHDAIRTEDVGLAKAIVAQAVTQRDADPVARALDGLDSGGWVDVVRQYVGAYPAEEQTVSDLYELGRRASSRQLSFNTAMRYAVPKI